MNNLFLFCKIKKLFLYFLTPKRPNQSRRICAEFRTRGRFSRNGRISAEFRTFR
ncbi:MAG: hypothetical protein Q8881_03265 [Sweet potato little leaf phytoplasma]|nr:hypothetical protein [Sweet potato little leaf phytoplasma]